MMFFCTTLTGCYDALEIDDEVYTLAIGIDKGTNNKIRLTIQYPVYKSESGGESKGGGQTGDKGKGGGQNTVSGTNVETIETSSIIGGLDIFGMSISRRVSLMHTKLLIFSEEFAKEGVSRYLSPISRFRETRGEMNILVVQGKAEDYMKENKTNIGESLAKAIELMMEQSGNTSFFPRVTFNKFYRNTISTFEQGYAAYAGVNDFSKLSSESKTDVPPLETDKGFSPGNLPREGITKREYAGTAVFNGGKMVGTLNSSETRYFMMITGDFKRGILELRDKKSPDDVILLDIRPSRSPVLKGHFEHGTPVIDIKIRLEGDIGSIQSRINYENIKELEELNRQAADYIRENTVKVIDKVQKEYKSDIFSFGKKFAGYFSTIQEWEKYDWLSHFKDAKVNVTVSFNIRRTGLMINSSTIHEAK